MTLQRQIGFWVIAAIGFIAFLLTFSGILLPFVAGMALAYLLDPLADRLEQLGLSRGASTGVILIVFLLIVVLIVLLVVPILASQAASLIERVPGYIKSLQAFVTAIDEDRLARTLGMTKADLQSRLGAFVGQAAAWLGQLVQGLLSGGQAILSILSLMIITPVVAFYLLLDWDHMIERVDSWLPRAHRPVIHQLARDMDGVVSAFVRGQILVGVTLGTLYAVALTAVGLNFGLLIGFMAGLFGFIPYVGTGIGLTVGLATAFAQFGTDWVWIVAVAAIFMVGQVIEGYVLQPRLIGASVGLHPVWLMFSLFAFGSLFGFVGLLIAIPAAACVGVLFRFALQQYLDSPMYHGARVQAGRDSRPDPAPELERP